MTRAVVYSNYSPVSDMTVTAVCFVIIIQLIFSYVNRSRSYRIYVSLVGFLLAAAWFNITYHMLAAFNDPLFYPTAYTMRCLYHASLFTIFAHYVIYIAEVTRLNRRQKLPFLLLALALLITMVAADVILTVRGARAQVPEAGLASQGQKLFMMGYLGFAVLVIVMMARVRKRLYKRVMMSFYATMALSFGLLITQAVFEQSSFTVASFLFPMLTMLYTLHANPYDAQLGAIDSKGLSETVRYYTDRKQDFLFFSLYMHSFNEEGVVLPLDLQAAIRRFASDFFRGTMLFQVGRGHMMLVINEKRNPDFARRAQRMFDAFQEEYSRFKYDYKIVYGRSIPEISRKNEYVSFIRSIQRGMEENTVYRVGPDDVRFFNRSEYILRELEDIYQKHDLDDPRVLAYCQPVLNIRTKRYDTAEALMRLRLDGLGLVFPDQFIPLAEENGYIHVLTEIILSKTCEELRKLIQAGYDITRISVNVSAQRLDNMSNCMGDNGKCNRRTAFSRSMFHGWSSASSADSGFRPRSSVNVEATSP